MKMVFAARCDNMLLPRSIINFEPQLLSHQGGKKKSLKRSGTF